MSPGRQEVFPIDEKEEMKRQYGALENGNGNDKSKLVVDKPKGTTHTYSCSQLHSDSHSTLIKLSIAA